MHEQMRSHYTGHIPYSGQIRLTNFQSYLNISIFVVYLYKVRDLKFLVKMILITSKLSKWTWGGFEVT